MRIPFSISALFAPSAASGRARPDELRRRVIRTASSIGLGGGVLAMPLAIYALSGGWMLPVFVVLGTIAAGAASLHLHRRGRDDGAVAVQAGALIGFGALLSWADPAVAGFGLAVALLGPVHAAMLASARVRKLSWAALALVIAAMAAGIAELAPAVMSSGSATGWLAAAIYVAGAAMVAYAANRLNTAYEVYDRAQINVFRHLVEHVQDAVVRFSAGGEVLFTSHSAERLFGCRRFELSAQGLVERVHVLDRPAYMTALSAAGHGGETRLVEVRMRRDGHEDGGPASRFVWIEAALSPVADPDAHTGRHEVVMLLRDITRRKDQEAEMARARQAAEDASNAKSRFLATVGHELRTPLNAIVGFSEMMASGIGGKLEPVHEEYTGLIRQSGQHLLDVVNMLLDVSRIEAGKFELNAEAFDPAGLVEPCLQMVERLARDRRVTLRSELAQSLPSIVGDERACRQIIINLLSNAIKFSEDGGTVVLGMKRQGVRLAISVSDRGIGMTAEIVERLGEPFFQAQSDLSRRYEGTGLGLSIVKGLVELHEGTLRASSVPGQGTTMTVLLPINGPETKLPDSETVTRMPRASEDIKTDQWPERKSAAR